MGVSKFESDNSFKIQKVILYSVFLGSNPKVCF